MKEVKLNGSTVAIFLNKDRWNRGLDFLTPNETFIQAGTWWYDKGQRLKAHKHIHNERNVNLTQETIVIMSGKLEVELYDDKNEIFISEILSEGDIGIILSCGHGYNILEDDTKVIEVKNGPFISVEKDKELINQ